MNRLTKRTVDALKPTRASYFVWDEELRGFGVRVSPKGAKTFVVQYRAGGRSRRLKLGRYGAVAADEARSKARELLGDVAAGGNPAEVASVRRGAPTVREVGQRFLRDHVDVRLKPGTAKGYRSMMENVIIPALGTRKIVDISRADIADLHHERRDTPYQANRVLSLLSKFFNVVEVWGLRPDGSNPCRHVSKFPEKRRERFLSADEVMRLGEVLSAAEADGTESPQVVAAFRLLLLTGCRMREIQHLKWEYVTATHLALPDSKTGARKLPLPPAALNVLRSLPRLPKNPFVITGAVEGQPITDLEKPWRRVRTAAKLPEVRIHDLRHTYASSAVMAGLSLPVVGKILGHTQLATTMRYAHLADEPVREAAARVSEQLGTLLGNAPAAKKASPRLRVVG